jgi:hypothetical protein
LHAMALAAERTLDDVTDVCVVVDYEDLHVD